MVNEKEKLELKIELLEDLLNCFQFNFTAMDNTLKKKMVQDMLDAYQGELERLK